MNVKNILNTVLSAAACGGIAAVALLPLDPLHFDWHRTAVVFGAGAVIGVVQHFRTPPGSVSIPK